MSGRGSVAQNTAKAKKIACKEANLMHTIGCSVEYLLGEKRFPFYVEDATSVAKERSQKYRNEVAMKLLIEAGIMPF